MSEKKYSSIYVELDVLLDTRLATVALLDAEIASALALESSGYRARESDEFTGIDKAAFDERYRTRNTETLAASVVTEGIQLIRHLAGELTEKAIEGPHLGEAKIVVNVFPYVLSNVEEEQIGRAIAAWMQGIAPVELVSIQPKDLTPAHCKSTYTTMLVYEYAMWMETHAEAFKRTRLSDVTMYVPAIYFEKVPTAEELAVTIRESAHPMRALELIASLMINLKVIDVKYFSILSNNTESGT